MGIGALLNQHPEYRYLFGSVSISNTLPEPAKQALVAFYRHYFPAQQRLAIANHAFRVTEHPGFELKGDHYDDDFKALKSYLGSLGASVPTLYKQYSDLCEPGGVQFLEFGVDPDFSDSIDGLVLVDIHRLKARKRKRYLGVGA